MRKLLMTREYLSSKRLQDYRELYRECEQGRILIPDSLVFICEVCHYNPNEIGRQFIEIAAKFMTEKGAKVYE